MAKVAKKEGSKVNKSAEIRSALTQHPDKPPRWIAENLTEKGVKVSAGMVSTIKTKLKHSKGKRPGRKPGRKSATLSKSSANAMAHEAIDAAFDFVHKVGGLLNAQLVIDKLKAFKERM
ncbi:MAG TPA: hypothetical protein VG713_02750 [Pirellulales bacterium]|nr:hypothetical protein [Pirellulales bacterium]